MAFQALVQGGRGEAQVANQAVRFGVAAVTAGAMAAVENLAALDLHGRAGGRRHRHFGNRLRRYGWRRAAELEGEHAAGVLEMPQAFRLAQPGAVRR